MINSGKVFCGEIGSFKRMDLAVELILYLVEKLNELKLPNI